MRTAIFIMVATILGILVQAARPVLSDDVVSVQHREDKNFDVSCKNSTSEIVSDIDLKLNNVCPKKFESEKLNIASIDYRADGSFSVICQDRQVKVANRQDILAGRICSVTEVPAAQAAGL